MLQCLHKLGLRIDQMELIFIGQGCKILPKLIVRPPKPAEMHLLLIEGFSKS